MRERQRRRNTKDNQFLAVMRVCVFVCVHCNSTEKSSTNDGFGGGKEEKPNHTESRNVYEMTINETKLQRE